MDSKNRIFLVLLSLVVFSGCVSIPAEAPELSNELGKQINSLEKSNMQLLTAFFKMKKEAVDEFVVKVWIPEFANEVFSNPQIDSLWNEIVSNDNKEDRLDFVVHMGTELQLKLHEKRLEYLKPLEDLETMIAQRIREEFNTARSINNTITSFLISAAEVAENRERYMNVLGVTGTQISGAISDIDKIVSKAVEISQNAQNKVEKLEEYETKLEEVMKNFK